MSMRGVPRLPHAKALKPASCSRRPVRVVVVLLPLVPVMPMIFPFRNRDADSISLAPVERRLRGPAERQTRSPALELPNLSAGYLLAAVREKNLASSIQ